MDNFTSNLSYNTMKNIFASPVDQLEDSNVLNEEEKLATKWQYQEKNETPQ